MEITHPATITFFFPNLFAKGQMKSIPAANGIPLINASTDWTMSAESVVPNTVICEKYSWQKMLNTYPPLNMTPIW